MKTSKNAPRAAKAVAKKQAGGTAPKLVALRVDVCESKTYWRASGKQKPVSQMLLTVTDEKYGEFMRRLNALTADFN